MTSDGPVTSAATSVLDALGRSQTSRIPFSVEFSPPKDAAGEERVWRALRAFEELGPAFVSMTYGAGGSTRDRTLRITEQISQRCGVLPVAHLTAVNHSVAELEEIIAAYSAAGIKNLLALRGDPPGDPLGEWVKHPEGVEYAEELVRMTLEQGDFHVGVASFPQSHYRSPNEDSDTKYLVSKLRAGADYSITQMFFDVDDYLRLRDRVVACDPEQGAKPIIPELMPVTSLSQVSRMAELSGSQLPDSLTSRLARAAGDGPEENRDAVRAEGIAFATEMAERLIAEGAPCLHFITLNFSRATLEVLQNLGMTDPAAPATSG